MHNELWRPRLGDARSEPHEQVACVFELNILHAKGEMMLSQTLFDIIRHACARPDLIGS